MEGEHRRHGWGGVHGMCGWVDGVGEDVPARLTYLLYMVL